MTTDCWQHTVQAYHGFTQPSVEYYNVYYSRHKQSEFRCITKQFTDNYYIIIYSQIYVAINQHAGNEPFQGIPPKSSQRVNVMRFISISEMRNTYVTNGK
jgi:hypothetical protein